MARATVSSQVQAMFRRVSEGSTRKGSFGSPDGSSGDRLAVSRFGGC
jgi:hypothetical protein